MVGGRDDVIDVARTAERPRLVLSSNSLWNIRNFRGALARRLANEGFELIFLAPANSDEAASCDLPGSVEQVSLDRSGMNLLRDFALLRFYRRRLRSLRPAAYLSWTIKPNIYGAMAARSLGIPVLLNVSGLGTAFLSGNLFGRLIGALYRSAFRGAAVVFFQNGDDRDLFVARRIVTPSQARLLPGSGVDLAHFAATPTPHATGRPVFLLVARLLGDKGVREFVEAARLVRAQLPGARFQLLGPIDDGNRTAVARSELAGWLQGGLIEYLGETDDVRPAIAAATAVVLPSYREGLPRTLLEGAAMGRPLVATDVPGCREVVEEGVNGFLCRVHDAASLADALLRLARLEPAAVQAMGSASRALVERRFAQELVHEAYVKALCDVGVMTGSR